MMKRLLLALSLSIGVANLQAQAPSAVLTQARQDIAVLTSDSLAGRGYLDRGHLRASAWLARRFAALGLQPLVPAPGGDSSFFQAFSFPLNLIEGGHLLVQGDSLRPGYDFIVSRYSGAGAAAGKMLDLGHALVADEFTEARGRVVVFRDGWPKHLADDSEAREALADLGSMLDRIMAIAAYEPAAVIVLEEKLTHGFVAEQAPFPILEVKADAWPRRARRVALQVSARMARIESRNVLGYLPATAPRDDSVVVVCAHYDHLGRLEDGVFAGANDNASGTAMLLSMAAELAARRDSLARDVLFIAFGAEEVGLIGSRYYAQAQPVIELSRMRFLLNLDLMGNGVDGIMAVGGRDYPQLFDALVALNDRQQAVPKVRARANAPNSDHYWFLEQGVAGFFIYTLGGPSHYHDVYDNAANLQLSRYEEVRHLLLTFLLEQFLGT